MNKDAFESVVLELWVQTNIRLTMANLQYHSGLPRRKVRPRVDELVREGVLEMDSDELGELYFTVPGARRNPHGPRSFDELERLQHAAGKSRKRRKRRKSAGNDDASTALISLRDAGKAAAIARRARRELDRGDGANKKSILASAGLSFLLGPLGWFYAGSYREAAVGTIGFLALASILPNVLMLPLMTVLMPISGVAGLVYAWQYNRSGERTRILGRDED